MAVTRKEVDKRTQAITEIKHCSIFKGELKRLGLTTHCPRRRGKTAKVPTLKALSICEAIIRAEVVISTNIQACQKKRLLTKVCTGPHFSTTISTNLDSLCVLKAYKIHIQYSSTSSDSVYVFKATPSKPIGRPRHHGL